MVSKMFLCLIVFVIIGATGVLASESTYQEHRRTAMEQLCASEGLNVFLMDELYSSQTCTIICSKDNFPMYQGSLVDGAPCKLDDDKWTTCYNGMCSTTPYKGQLPPNLGTPDDAQPRGGSNGGSNDEIVNGWPRPSNWPTYPTKPKPRADGRYDVPPTDPNAAGPMMDPFGRSSGGQKRQEEEKPAMSWQDYYKSAGNNNQNSNANNIGQNGLAPNNDGANIKQNNYGIDQNNNPNNVGGGQNNFGNNGLAPNNDGSNIGQNNYGINQNNNPNNVGAGQNNFGQNGLAPNNNGANVGQNSYGVKQNNNPNNAGTGNSSGMNYNPNNNPNIFNNQNNNPQQQPNQGNANINDPNNVQPNANNDPRQQNNDPNYRQGGYNYNQNNIQGGYIDLSNETPVVRSNDQNPYAENPKQGNGQPLQNGGNSQPKNIANGQSSNGSMPVNNQFIPYNQNSGNNTPVNSLGKPNSNSNQNAVNNIGGAGDGLHPQPRSLPNGPLQANVNPGNVGGISESNGTANGRSSNVRSHHEQVAASNNANAHEGKNEQAQFERRVIKVQNRPIVPNKLHAPQIASIVPRHKAHRNLVNKSPTHQSKQLVKGEIKEIVAHKPDRAHPGINFGVRRVAMNTTKEATTVQLTDDKKSQETTELANLLKNENGVPGAEKHKDDRLKTHVQPKQHVAKAQQLPDLANPLAGADTKPAWLGSTSDSFEDIGRPKQNPPKSDDPEPPPINDQNGIGKEPAPDAIPDVPGKRLVNPKKVDSNKHDGILSMHHGLKQDDTSMDENSTNSTDLNATSFEGGSSSPTKKTRKHKNRKHRSRKTKHTTIAESELIKGKKQQ